MNLVEKTLILNSDGSAGLEIIFLWYRVIIIFKKFDCH